LNKKLVIILVILFSILYVNAQITDTDNDDMPDDWEDEYDLNKTDPSDRNEDLDDDTITNVNEYLAGCDPSEPDSDDDCHSDVKEIQYNTNCSNDEYYPNASLIDISLITPEYGVAQLSTFNFTIETSNKSHCKFHFSNQENYSEIDLDTNIFDTTDGYTHNIPDKVLNFENTVAVHYIYCKADSSGYENNEFPVPIGLSVDTTLPEIEAAYADPDKVIETLNVDLKVETDDKTICRFDLFGYIEQNYTKYIKWFDGHDISEYKEEHIASYSKNSDPKIEDMTNYTFYVHCKNIAGWFLEKIVPINFSVDLSEANVITKLSPSGYISEKDVQVRVETNKNTDCKFGEYYPNSFPQTNAKIHYIEKRNLDEINYSIPIMCIFADWSTVEDVIEFTVDFTKPSNVKITTNVSTCDNTSLAAKFSATDSSGITGYYYRLTDSSNNIILDYTYTSLPYAKLENLTLKRLGKYYWEVIVVDAAGNNATPAKKSSAVTILSKSNLLCIKNRLPYLNISATLTETDVKLSLLCKDPDGSCSKREYFLTDSDCSECDDCTYIEYLPATTISVTEDSRLCYKITDNDNATDEDSFEIKFETCTTSAECCVGRESYICNPDCEKITNVECDPENVDSDNDGIPDLKEDECGLNANDATDADKDNDGDGLTNSEECLDYNTDLNKKDSDGDGYTDKEEVDGNSDPNDNRDYPANGDLDDDDISEQREEACGLDRTKNDADDDNDGDGLTNYEECVKYRTYNIDPNIADSDGDGVSDKIEIDKGTDPDNNAEFPKSYVLNIILFILGLGLIVAGIFVFSKDSKDGFKMPRLTKADMKKPMVDFKDTQKQMQQQVQQMPVQKTAAWPKRNIDLEILRKREMLKMKKMNSIFDEFAEDKDEIEEKEHPAYKKLDKLPKKSKVKTFKKLDTMSKKDVFKELDELSKKDEEKKLSQKKQGKLDKLSGRKK